MNVIFHTLGCKVNQYETQGIREMFLSSGYTADNKINPDIIVINSCSVTAESDRKTRQTVRKFRKNYPNSVIILTGCMVQAFPNEAFNISEADIVLGNKDFSNIINITEDFIKTKERKLIYNKHENKEKYNTKGICDFEERTRAYMKIEDGCDRFCSYCIIPYSRGRVRSRNIESIKEEAKNLSLKGFCEIVLVGINLSAYGKNEDFDICDAVDAVCEIDGIKRVRLGSLEPDHITDLMLNRLNNQEKFCPQFHLSLQSGCDETLKRMNRKYDSDFYFDLVSRIRKIFKNPSITTDIMVGFSGETEEEFENSLKFAEKVGFARTHIFPYSVRPGTFAENFANQIENSVKSNRAKQMLLVSEKSERLFLESQVGKTETVLFETPENGYAVGYTENYTRVKVKTLENLLGKILNVKIIEAFGDYCLGVIV